MPERRITLLHELKHIIDGGHATKLHQRGSQSTGEALCTEFAMSVLMPGPWLRHDWQNGQRDVSALAKRYDVPVEALEHRLHTLGLRSSRTRLHPRSRCHWQPHPNRPRARRSPR